ncbi:MAG: alpha/beta hydrolase [Lysobacteraceae bacterium]|nr:MAG: alpha/beta hydrolase [Xanthomonadaceae bacterium]
MRLTQPVAPPFEEACDPATHFPAGYIPVPQRFDAGSEGRIAEILRSKLSGRDPTPTRLLIEAGRSWLDGDHPTALATADLTVSGRRMWQAFRSAPPTVDTVYASLRASRRRDRSDPRWRDALLNVVLRAYRSAWILQGYGDRAAHGWIAVSAEQDPPHRPVNVPRAPQPQHDLTVNVRATATSPARSVVTRFIIARPDERAPTADWMASSGRFELPPIPPITFGDGERLLIYVHGHSSRAEECMDFAGPAAAQGFTVVAMDLPCNGYGEMFDHTEIASDADTDRLDWFPLLDFIEQFIVDFILALEAASGRSLQKQIAAVVGGSLGGNMGLRLAGRDMTAHAYLANIVSWSAASVWNPLDNVLMEAGPNTTRARMKIDPPSVGESENRRAEYFFQVFDESHNIIGFKVSYPQGEYWYRNDWPCKPASISGARADRKEMYNRFFRRWHWRVAFEQLLFSHRAFGRNELPRARMLLLAGDQDDHLGAHIYDATKDLSVTMITTPGARRLMQRTGHSIHNERPVWLAQQIAAFLPPDRPDNGVEERWSDWQSLGGILTSKPAVGINEDGRIEVVARGLDQHLHRLRQTAPNGAFDSGWAGMHGNLDGNDRFGASIAMARNDDGRLELFAQLAQVGWIAHVWQGQANGEWGGWSKGNHLGQLIGGATDAIAATERVGSETLQLAGDGLRFDVPKQWLRIVSRLNDGRLYIKGNNVHGWDGAGQVGTAVPGPARYIGVPAIARNRNGMLQIFARDTVGEAIVISEPSTDAWGRAVCTRIGGGTLSSDIAVAMCIDGRLEIFARGADGSLWHAYQLAPNGAWSGWASMAVAMIEGSMPAVALNAWGGLQVFVRGPDNQIRYRRQTIDGGWGWTEPRALLGIADSDPVVAANADGTLCVFTLAPDRSLQMARQSTQVIPRVDLRYVLGPEVRAAILKGSRRKIPRVPSP